MTSAVGASLILCASVWIALSMSSALARHVRALDALIISLELVKSEIVCRMTPLPELMRRLSEDAPPPAAGIFEACLKKLPELGEKTMTQLWSEAVYEAAPRELTKEETALYATVGLSLGRFDSDEQAQALSAVTERLRRHLKRAEEEKAEKSKVYAGLSLTLGLMLVIILL